MIKRAFIALLLCASLAQGTEVYLGSLSDVTWVGSGTEFYAVFGGVAAGWADTNAPIAMWEMNETNATQTLDTSAYAGGLGSGYNASNKPSVASGPTRIIAGTNENGRVEYGYTFDGASQYFDISDSLLTAVGSDTNGTLNLWLSVSNSFAAVRNVFSLTSATAAPFTYFDVDVYQNKVRFIVRADNVQVANVSSPTITVFDAPMMITLVQDGTGINFYTNGVFALDGGAANSEWTANVIGISTSAAYASIGTFRNSGGGSQYYDSNIYEVDYYNYPLSTNQIAELYQYTQPTNNTRIRN